MGGPGLRTLPFIVAAGALLALAACRVQAPATPLPSPTPSPGGDLTLSGLVYDAGVGPGKGIAGATVSAVMSVPRTFQTLTGPDGRFSLLLPALYLTAGGEVTLEVRAGGYATYSESVSVVALRARPEKDFALRPVPGAGRSAFRWGTAAILR